MLRGDGLPGFTLAAPHTAMFSVVICGCEQLWHYVFFIVHLLKVHRSEMNGIETRIFKMMQVRRGDREPDLTWMDLHELPPWKEETAAVVPVVPMREPSPAGAFIWLASSWCTARTSLLVG